MDHIVWFFHIFGLILWFGALMGTGIVLWLFRRTDHESRPGFEYARLVRVLNPLNRIGSLLVLVSGILLFALRPANQGHAALWIRLMMQIGGSTIIASLILISSLGSQALKQMSKPASEGRSKTPVVQSYAAAIWVLLVLVLTVLAIVSSKIH